jgi:hypothetical protein
LLPRFKKQEEEAWREKSPSLEAQLKPYGVTTFGAAPVDVVVGEDGADVVVVVVWYQ